MKGALFQHTIDGFRYKHWTAFESIMYFLRCCKRIDAQHNWDI